MACPESGRLASFLAGGLSPAERRGLEDHLSGCLSCQNEIDELRELRKAGMAGGPRLSAEEWAALEIRTFAAIRSGRRAKGAASSARLKACALPGSASRLGPATRRRPSVVVRSRRQPSRLAGQVLLLASAAAAVLLAVGIFARSMIGDPAVQARITAASGAPMLLASGSWRPARLGEAVMPGTAVTTGQGSSLELLYPDGTGVLLNGDTTLALLEGGRGKRLSLDRGDILVAAAKQPAGRPLMLNPGRPDQAAVLGTTLELSRPAGQTVLRVAEGLVRFGPETAGVSVGSGQASRVLPGMAPSRPEPCPLSEIAAWRLAGPMPSPESGLLVHWKLEDGAGTTATDFSGRLNHGPLVGGPTWTTRDSSGALSFDGQDDSVSLARVKGLPAGNAPHTIAAWVRIGALPANRAWILLLGNEGPSAHHWLIDNSGWSQLGAWSGAQLHPELPIGQWRHLAVTFDGTIMRGYVNGITCGAMQATFDLQGVPLNVGKKSADAGQDNFNGTVDEVRVYNRALTASEVAALAK